MPTDYIKKLAKLNHTTVNKIEKFWSQAKEIAKSEGNGKAWGLITTIFQNKLKKEGYKVKAIAYDSINSPESTKQFYEDLEKELKDYRENKVVSDTDEYDDADLGINVDPKEYHKQKSLQMSLQSKLDMIKNDINKETDEYNKEIEEIAKRLNEENRKRYSRDNNGDEWLHYSGTVNKEVLLEAYKDGLACVYEGFGTITNDEDIREELNYYKNRVYPRFKKLINGSSLRVYRGLDFQKLLYSDRDLLKDYFKYLKYNLMDRNSWTTSIEVAKRYIDYKWSSIILQMDCTLEDANLPLSAWLEGYWFDNESKEINLKKSLKVKNIKCVFVGDDLKKLGFNEKEFNKVAAFKEETREVDDRKFIFKRLSLSDCVKQIKDLFDDYFNFGKKDPEYYEKLYNTKVDETTASDLLPSDDFTVYIEYNDGSKWYSVADPKLKDLKLTGIKNCIIEYPAYTAYFGKDCRIERFDNAEDAPYVIKCEAKMNKYSAKKATGITFNMSKVEELSDESKELLEYKDILNNKFRKDFKLDTETESLKCPIDSVNVILVGTRRKNKKQDIIVELYNNSTDKVEKFHTFNNIQSALPYIENLFKTRATASAEKVFAYKGKIITSGSKEEAIKQIVTSSAKPFKYKGTIVYAVDKEKAAIAYTCATITRDLVKKLKPIVKKLEVTFYEDDHYNYNSWNKKTAKDKLVVITGGTYDYNEKGKNAVAIEIGWEHGKSTYDCIKPEDMERYITNDIIPVANSFMRKHKGFSTKPIINYLSNCDLYRVVYVMEDKK